MIKKLTHKILHAGITAECSAEDRKKILISSNFTLISVFLLIFFGIDNLNSGNIGLAQAVFAIAAINFSNYVYLCISSNYRVSALMIVFIMSGLCFYLLISGGNQNTGPLWLFVLPIIIYYVLGLRIGTFVLVLMLCVVFYILFTPDALFLSTSYDRLFSIRFFGSFAVVSIMAFIYEYTREEGRRELIALNQRLDKISQTDDLTQLANRRAMTRQISHEIDRFERNNRPFCLLAGDIDHFKEVNDRFGHECGDLVLKSVAGTLDKNTKKQDIVARWGGEEFLILLPETNISQGRYSAERLRQAIEDLSTSFETRTIKVTMSFGLSEYGEGQSYNDLIRAVDDLLYKAKFSGRNQVV